MLRNLFLFTCTGSTFSFPWSNSHRPPPPVGRGPLIIEASKLHSDAPHSVGIPWMSDQPVAVNLYLYNTQHSQQTYRHALGGNRNPQSLQASGRRHAPYTARPLASVNEQNGINIADKRCEIWQRSDIWERH